MNIKQQLNQELNKVFDSSWQWVYDMVDEPQWVADKEEWQGYLAETEERDYSLKVIFKTLKNHLELAEIRRRHEQTQSRSESEDEGDY